MLLQVGLLQGIPYVSLGYEKSADEGNGVYVGVREVNHQYDKSSIFMTHAAQYIKQYIHSQVVVESHLRDMLEIEVLLLYTMCVNLFDEML